MENTDTGQDEINFLFSPQIELENLILYVKFRIYGDSLIDEIMNLNGETATNSLVPYKIPPRGWRPRKTERPHHLGRKGTKIKCLKRLTLLNCNSCIEQ
jgi:hypothetical protein